MIPRRVPRLLLSLVALLLASLSAPHAATAADAPDIEELRAKARATQDSKEAHKLWLQLAEQGDAEAQFEVGSYFHLSVNEIGVGYDWYMKAARQGNVDAMIQLGHIADDTQSNEDEYSDEDRKNDAEAVRWWTKAAELGSDEARSQLANMQVLGTGLPKDRVKARETLIALVAKGSDSARFFLRNLNRIEGLDEETGIKAAVVAAPAEQEKSPTLAADQPAFQEPAAPVKNEQEIRLDQLLAKFMSDFGSTSYPENRTKLMEEYAAAVRAAHAFENVMHYRDAIEPLLKSPVAANPETAEQILRVWSSRTQDDEYILRDLLPPEVRAAVERRKEERRNGQDEAKKIVEAYYAKSAPAPESPKNPKNQEELCEEKIAKSRFIRGLTVNVNGFGLVILESFDCSADEYIAWRPKQGDDSLSAALMKKVRVKPPGGVFYAARNQYHRCEQCDGYGQKKVIVETTRTKELPFGYFSGIQTISTRTTSKEEIRWCYGCDGRGVVLK